MKRNSLKHYSIMTVLVAALICIQGISLANDPEARAIMKKLEEQSSSNWNSWCNMASNIEMEVTGRDGKKMTRQIRYFTKCKEEKRLTLAFFLYPPDVKNIGFLSHDYNDPQKEDTNWLYLPSLKRVRRVVSPEESKSLMGIDISQLSGLSFSGNSEDYQVRFYKKKEMVIEGVPTWAIEVTPTTQEEMARTGYEKHLLFIRKNTCELSRLISFEQKESTRIIISFKKTEIIDGVKQYTEIHIKEKQGKQIIQQTTVKFSDMKLNQDLNDRLFSIRMLKKGP